MGRYVSACSALPASTPPPLSPGLTVRQLLGIGSLDTAAHTSYFSPIISDSPVSSALLWRNRETLIPISISHQGSEDLAKTLKSYRLQLWSTSRIPLFTACWNNPCCILLSSPNNTLSLSNSNKESPAVVTDANGAMESRLRLDCKHQINSGGRCILISDRNCSLKQSGTTGYQILTGRDSLNFHFLT